MFSHTLYICICFNWRYLYQVCPVHVKFSFKVHVKFSFKVFIFLVPLIHVDCKWQMCVLEDNNIFLIIYTSKCFLCICDFCLFLKLSISTVYKSFHLYFNNNACLVQTPRTYCCANTEDLEAVIHHVHSLYPVAPFLAAGVSMGG